PRRARALLRRAPRPREPGGAARVLEHAGAPRSPRARERAGAAARGTRAGAACARSGLVLRVPERGRGGATVTMVLPPWGKPAGEVTRAALVAGSFRVL